MVELLSEIILRASGNGSLRPTLLILDTWNTLTWLASSNIKFFHSSLPISNPSTSTCLCCGARYFLGDLLLGRIPCIVLWPAPRWLKFSRSYSWINHWSAKQNRLPPPLANVHFPETSKLVQMVGMLSDRPKKLCRQNQRLIHMSHDERNWWRRVKKATNLRSDKCGRVITFYSSSSFFLFTLYFCKPDRPDPLYVQTTSMFFLVIILFIVCCLLYTTSI